MWGVFKQREEHGEVHVVPSHPDGTILDPHTVDVLCICKPVPELPNIPGNRIIVVHNKLEEE